MWDKPFKQWRAHPPKCWVTFLWEYMNKAGLEICRSGEWLLDHARGLRGGALADAGAPCAMGRGHEHLIDLLDTTLPGG